MQPALHVACGLSRVRSAPSSWFDCTALVCDVGCVWLFVLLPTVLCLYPSELALRLLGVYSKHAHFLLLAEGAADGTPHLLDNIYYTHYYKQSRTSKNNLYSYQQNTN